MFICSVHGNTVKLFGIIGIAVLTLVMLVVLLPKNTSAAYENENANERELEANVTPQESTREVGNFDRVKTNDDRVALIRGYGWEVEEEPIDEKTVTIPVEFDSIMESYNDIQRQQGFDLSKYRNREMTRYTYRITNYPDYSGTVICNILIYKNRVVGADICSSDVNGFISGLCQRNTQ